MTVNLFITQLYLTASEGLNYSARCVNTFKVCKIYVYNFFLRLPDSIIYFHHEKNEMDIPLF